MSRFKLLPSSVEVVTPSVVTPPSKIEDVRPWKLRTHNLGLRGKLEREALRQGKFWLYIKIMCLILVLGLLLTLVPILV